MCGMRRLRARAAQRAAAPRSRNKSLRRRHCAPRESEPRHVDHLAGVVDDVAFDHQDRHAFMLFGIGDQFVKGHAAQIYRHADRGVEGCGLRQRAHEIGAPADDDAVEDDQREDRQLQPRQQPAALAPGSRPVAARRDGLDVRRGIGFCRGGFDRRLTGVEIDRRNRGNSTSAASSDGTSVVIRSGMAAASGASAVAAGGIISTS